MRLLRRALALAGIAVLVLLGALAGYHRLALPAEAQQLRAPGTLVQVEGRILHVLDEGPRDGQPALVLMAGAATIAPVYDFRVLAELLAVQRRTVIIEKTGYGYSEIADVDRGLEVLVAENREVLFAADVAPPYVLVAHSMAGLEALAWAQQHPDEVAGIIGLDASTPAAYAAESALRLALVRTAGGAAAWLGLQRVPGAYPLPDAGLTDAEKAQHRLLLARNAGNIAVLRESERVLDNAAQLGAEVDPGMPMLLFSSDGRELPANWVAVQRELAERTGAQLVLLDCGHTVHHCAPERIARDSLLFAGGLG